jgi:hypothetical protein
MGSSSQHDDEATATGQHRVLEPGAQAAALLKQIDRSVELLQQVIQQGGASDLAVPIIESDQVVIFEVKMPPQAHFIVDSPSRNTSQGVYVLTSSEGDHAIARTLDDERVDLNLYLHDLDRSEAVTLQRLLGANLRSLLAAARHENAEHRIQQLIQAIAPRDPLADVQFKVAEATLALRKDFLDSVPIVTSAEVHANAGFPGGNASQTVHRWRKQGRIFSISHGGRDLYPTFQFGQDGRPLPIIAEVLKILGRDAERSDWDNALWFAGDSGWLDGKRPIDCLQSDAEGVKRAAEQEVLVDEY